MKKAVEKVKKPKKVIKNKVVDDKAKKVAKKALLEKYYLILEMAENSTEDGSSQVLDAIDLLISLIKEKYIKYLSKDECKTFLENLLLIKEKILSKAYKSSKRR